MRSHSIPDPETLRREIKASHERCKSYGLNPKTIRNPLQRRLTSDELADRIEQNREFLDIAITQMEELYQFVAGAGFAVTIADREGYIIYIIGDPPFLQKLALGNCCPGYRWTEKDVGTSVISLMLARMIPVQINDNEHFCQRGYGHTCSAAPVFGPDDRLLGVIALSGDAQRVHPHTLGMVITSARAIENQLRVQKASKELQLRNNYMSAIINSIDSGVIAVGENCIINRINRQGRRILQWRESPVGQPLAAIFGKQLDWSQLMRPGFEIVDREIILRSAGRTIQLLFSAKPIFDSNDQRKGTIVVFNEINRIRKIVHEMAGTQARFTFEDIISVSKSIREVKKMAMIVALGKSTVLLFGETGTGKELFAQAIHNASERSHYPFLAINCGAIPRELFESELFGYAGGAFTSAHKGGRPGKFELADGGTVFLDEIGDMPTDMQVKLLRVLQTGEVYRVGEHKSIAVDVRIIAATNSKLDQKVVRGDFREDLFYRLNVFPITIPPLRERIGDIIPLTKHFLKHCARALNKPGMQFSAEVEKILINYQWPGNIRELENAIERAVNLAESNKIEPETLGIGTLIHRAAIPKECRESLLEEMEKQTIMEIITEMQFNLSKSAKVLGICRATLYKKIKRYGLPTSPNSV